MHCYLITVATKHRTHEHRQTDCATCMVQMWCSYNKCGSSRVKLMDKDGSSHLSPSQSWMIWVERSVIEPVRAAFILPCSTVCNIGHEHAGCLSVQHVDARTTFWLAYAPPNVHFRLSRARHTAGGRKDSKPWLVMSILWHAKFEVQKWLWDQNISCCCWDMGNLTVRYGRCLNYVDRHGTTVHILSYVLLVCTYVCFSRTNNET